MSDESIHEWDAAYVLGALSPDDRRRFEAHLEECPECRAAVGELAVMPALLSRVPNPLDAPPPVEPAPLVDPAKPNVAGRLGEAERRPDQPLETRPAAAVQESDGLAAVAHQVRRRRIARRWGLAAASALAAAAIAAAVILPTSIAAPPAEGTRIALEQTTPSPLSATVSLTAKTWGTAVSMDCRYDRPTTGPYATGGAAPSRGYALYVTDASGQSTRVASWSAAPGSDVRAAGSIDLKKSQLRTVQVRDTATDTVLLSSPVK